MTQNPRIRRSRALPVDERRYRPGHPRDGVPTVSTREAAKDLHTTTQTVRDLIEADELEGYWRLIDKVYQFTVYRPAITDFISRYGRFPDARGRRRGQRAAAGPGSGAVQAEVMGLQEAVRRQSLALAKMQEAFEVQEQALDLLHEVNRLRTHAATRLRAAIDELNDVVADRGIPDFVPTDQAHRP